MKFLKINNKALLFSFFMGIALVFGSCAKDETVVPKTLDEYKAELSKIVSIEKPKVQNCVVGYNKGDFKSDLLYPDVTYTYMLALVSAEQVLAKPDLTIANIFAANKALSSPGKDFNANLWISDRRPIHELIVFCDTLRAHTPEGFEVGMCPPEPRNAFIAEISAAKSVRSSSTALDRQVLAAVDKLNLALGIFQEAIIK
ncbi:MAG: hypothetical protein H6538_00100 [Bacteroidales bacterium]|nr:hypothetical protein [Bacteroidales bacterium]MCB8999301.1 hypothetical protein [Bacteroidales bacterium]MCB9012443.1 hypothetical protein [Bacteroidales bacterium]